MAADEHPQDVSTLLEPPPTVAPERAWVDDLRERRPDALDELHALLLKAARFEVSRRRALHPHVRAELTEDLAAQAAGDALVSVLRRLDDFRGESRFTTWAYKFALLEAAVKVRRLAWQAREVTVEPEAWARFGGDAGSPPRAAEERELLAAVTAGIETALSERQRSVLVALTIEGVPIDVLAERLGTNRNALYKTLHDARRKLRAYLTERGLA
jgi:RNA polymerase sigma-70 factor (ECF subfamily)